MRGNHARPVFLVHLQRVPAARGNVADVGQEIDIIRIRHLQNAIDYAGLYLVLLRVVSQVNAGLASEPVADLVRGVGETLEIFFAQLLQQSLAGEARISLNIENKIDVFASNSLQEPPDLQVFVDHFLALIRGDHLRNHGKRHHGEIALRHLFLEFGRAVSVSLDEFHAAVVRLDIMKAQPVARVTGCPELLLVGAQPEFGRIAHPEGLLLHRPGRSRHNQRKSYGSEQKFAAIQRCAHSDDLVWQVMRPDVAKGR